MSQKVIVVGNSLAITIPKESARKLGLRAGSRIEMEVDARRKIGSFRSETVLSHADEHIARLTADFMRRYDKDLRELANR